MYIYVCIDKNIDTDIYIYMKKYIYLHIYILSCKYCTVLYMSKKKKKMNQIKPNKSIKETAFNKIVWPKYRSIVWPKIVWPSELFAAL